MFVISLCGCDDNNTENDQIPLIPLSLIESYPHDTLSFTEGLLFYNDTLFESTGSPYYLPETRSVFGPVDLSTGRISVRVELDKQKYFGEGITYLNGKFYQLTFTHKIGFVYDASTYKTIGQFFFLSDEGWGLTTDGVSLIMSDGSDKLTYLDTQTFLPTRILSITKKGTAIGYLNELEFINGFIYANHWQTSRILKIDPATGHVVAEIDLDLLATQADSLDPDSGEMNGIAYNPGSNTIFITGKLWPKVYEIALEE
jgi:glutamine cyclotransferase